MLVLADWFRYELKSFKSMYTILLYVLHTNALLNGTIQLIILRFFFSIMNLQFTKTLPLLKVFNHFNAGEFLLSWVHGQSILLDVAENPQDYLRQSRVGRLFCTPQSHHYVFFLYIISYFVMLGCQAQISGENN